MSSKNLEKGDFIEIDFTGRVKDGEVFDSTKKEDLEKLHAELENPPKTEAKPFLFSLGHNMFLPALDEFLLGKEVGQTYDKELPPDKAFGKRNPALIDRIPSRVFKEQKLNPVAGISLNFDGRIGKVLTVSGGRVVVDFNHSLSGKDVVYEIKILRKIEDLNEKIKALNDFFFRKDFEFTIDKEKKKLTLKVEKSMLKLVELFKSKFKEILDLDLEVKEAGSEDKEKK